MIFIRSQQGNTYKWYRKAILFEYTVSVKSNQALKYQKLALKAWSDSYLAYSLISDFWF